MKAREGFILRNLVGELVLMPVGAEIRSFQGLIRLNGLSAFIWQHLQQPTTPDALLDAILSEYDIDTPTASADLSEALVKMRSMGLLEG